MGDPERRPRGQCIQIHPTGHVPTASLVKPKQLLPGEFTPILVDLGLDAATPRGSTPGAAGAGLLIGQIGGPVDVPGVCAQLQKQSNAALHESSPALLFLEGARSDRELAAWRNALWPWLHAVCLYRIRGGLIERETLQGRTQLEGSGSKDGVLIVGRRKDHVLSPAATIEKFDQNAPRWNGEPGGKGYAHFRWMRRFVGLFGEPRSGQQILDFGCGAGWVGIEAVAAAGGGAHASLRSFDPSPEMVRITCENALASGVTDFEGRTGFGEAPPFPAAGQARFDHVISSGVVSFSPDVSAWVTGLASTVAPGGRLVVGDINLDSRGMHKRRASKVLLPAREMNARTAAEIRRRLEQVGFRHLRTAGYQLTWPIPEAMHLSDTRLGGVLTPLLLAANRLRAGSESLAGFDSWVMSFDGPQ